MCILAEPDKDQEGHMAPLKKKIAIGVLNPWSYT